MFGGSVGVFGRSVEFGRSVGELLIVVDLLGVWVKWYGKFFTAGCACNFVVVSRVEFIKNRHIYIVAFRVLTWSNPFYFILFHDYGWFAKQTSVILFCLVTSNVHLPPLRFFNGCAKDLGNGYRWSQNSN